MPDREKVIEGLENLRETIRTATQYTFTSGGICAMSMKRIDNALAMLKEDCHNCKLECLLQRYDKLKEKYDSLLKEQEAVERTSRTGINGFSIIWTCGSCGSDLHPNNAKAKFCSNCGRPVKWG